MSGDFKGLHHIHELSRTAKDRHWKMPPY